MCVYICLFCKLKYKEEKVFLQLFGIQNPNWGFEYLNTGKECSIATQNYPFL